MIATHAKQQETFPSHLRQYHQHMHTYRIGDAAALPGVAADPLRRRADGGNRTADGDEPSRRVIAQPALAACTRLMNRAGRESPGSSARNRLSGIVTDVRLADVSARVEIQAGPFRVVAHRRPRSVASRVESVESVESVEELKPEPGVPAVAVIKSTTVVVEKP